MKVLYDSHVLVSAFLNEKGVNQTGVYRFSEQMALQLQKNQALTLYLFSSLPKMENLLWKSTLQKRDSLKEFEPKNYYPPLKEKLDLANQKLAQASSWHRIWMKSVREVLRYFNSQSSYFKEDLKQFDLYFSPYHPAPKWVREKSDLITVHTIHDLIPLKYPKYFKVNKKSFFDRMLKNPSSKDYFFALSESTKADLCYYYSIDPKKIFVVHSAPKKDHFYPVKDPKSLTALRTKYQLQGPYLLSLATLEPRKNTSFLVDVFIDLIQNGKAKDLKLVLAGAKGWDTSSLMKKIEPYRDRIIVTGFIPDEDLAALYSAATAFIYPSLYEGFGLPPLEAMRCGTPVITSNRSSLPEVVQDAGLLVDPTSKQELQKAILQISTDTSLREQLNEKALVQSQSFTWEKNAQTALDAFEKILRS